MIILGRSGRRDEEISLIGRALDFIPRKITRAKLSTVAGEAVAMANAVDSGIFLLSMLVGGILRFGSVSTLGRKWTASTLHSFPTSS